MYGVVLMMAMSGASEAPDCGCLARLCCHERYYSCSCSGCSGCSGYVCSGCSGYACSGYACSGCSGCYGSHHGYSRCYGSCSGCTGCAGYYSYPMIVTPPMGAPLPPTSPLPPPAEKLGAVRAPGSVLVNVPADAVLYFDGVKMSISSGSRRFSTPPLEPGKTYFYTVRAEINQDGQTVATTERVLVRSGQQAQVSFDMTPAGTLTSHQE